MSEFTKGKLFVSASTLIINKDAWIIANTLQLGSVPGLTVNVREASAYAKELVRRWNAFEEGGSHDTLLAACEKANYVYDFAICQTPTGKEREKLTERNILRLQAIAAAKKE